MFMHRGLAKAERRLSEALHQPAWWAPACGKARACWDESLRRGRVNRTPAAPPQREPGREVSSLGFTGNPALRGGGCRDGRQEPAAAPFLRGAVRGWGKRGAVSASHGFCSTEQLWSPGFSRIPQCSATGAPQVGDAQM